MIIKEINDRVTWQKFFDAAGSPSFLQSWEWGEMERKQGYEIYRFGLYDNNNLVAIALVIKINSKRGKFLFVPHGPLSNLKDQESMIKTSLKTFKTYLMDLAEKTGCSFIRLSPLLADNEDNRKMFSDMGFKTAPIYMNAEDSWILPIDKTEDELLAGMRKTTRYLIRKAVRDRVVVTRSDDEKDIVGFLKVYKETAERADFVAFSDQYIRDEFKTFNDVDNVLIFTAKHNNKTLAAAIILFSDSTAFYHQGASIHSKIPAPYFLQWEAIKEAKKRGCRYYNFWGIKIPNRTPKNWDGLTMFKTGFGGYEAKYIPTQDFILSPKYYFTFVCEKILAWKRGV